MHRLLTIAAFAGLLTGCQTTTQEPSTPVAAPKPQTAPAETSDVIIKEGSGYIVEAPILVALDVTQKCPGGKFASLSTRDGKTTSLRFKRGQRLSGEQEVAFMNCVRKMLS